MRWAIFQVSTCYFGAFVAINLRGVKAISIMWNPCSYSRSTGGISTRFMRRGEADFTYKYAVSLFSRNLQTWNFDASIFHFSCGSQWPVLLRFYFCNFTYVCRRCLQVDTWCIFFVMCLQNFNSAIPSALLNFANSLVKFSQCIKIVLSINYRLTIL